MANVFAVHSVGDSVMTFLRTTYEQFRQTFPDADRPPQCAFELMSGGTLNDVDDPPLTLSLYMYRIQMNEHLREAPRVSRTGERRPPLSLDLHYLLTAWADNPVHENLILAWAMLQLHRNPVLDLSSLTPAGGWQAGDFVQFIPAELTNEDMMRIWDAVTPSYRLSTAYTARVVRIDGPPEEQGRPVVATRFDLEDEIPEQP